MPSLRITRDDVVIQADITLVHARVIALLATWGVEQCARAPEYAPVLYARLWQTIEGALQRTPSAHVTWCRLCEEFELPLNVEVSGVQARDGDSSTLGGGGGDGAWPGGGGGGGGARAGAAGTGGSGALLLLLLSEGGTLVDVDALVMPGSYEWTCPRGVTQALMVGCGGGGGGGSGG